MLRRLLLGCPCTAVDSRANSGARVAACNLCGQLFPIKTLYYFPDGTLVKMPCDQMGKDAGCQERARPIAA